MGTVGENEVKIVRNVDKYGVCNSDGHRESIKNYEIRVGETFFKSFWRKFRRLSIHSRLGIVEDRRKSSIAGDKFEQLEKFFREQANSSSVIASISKNPINSSIYIKNHPDYIISEMSALRQEIIDIKNREITSERLSSSSAIVFATIYFSGTVSNKIILAIPILFMLFGYLRAKEYERNIFEIDCYLREQEFWFSQTGGWVNYFFRFRRMEDYFHTRLWIWWTMFFSYLGAIIFLVPKNNSDNGEETSILDQIISLLQ